MAEASCSFCDSCCIIYWIDNVC